MAYPNSPEEVRIMSECQAKGLQKGNTKSLHGFTVNTNLPFTLNKTNIFFLLTEKTHGNKTF